MNKAERQACFQAAKARTISMLKAEIQAQLKLPTADREGRRLCDQVAYDMDHFLREVRKVKFTDWVKI
jgi:hypothetical protein